MIGKLVFGIAILLFLASWFLATFTLGQEQSLPGFHAFFTALRYGTAGVFSANSLQEFVTYFIALMAAAANFVFVFWAMLVFLPTKITSLKWFWWISLLFIMAAGYTGVLITLDERAMLRPGYFCWLAALLLMLFAPVVRRFERRRATLLARQRKTAVS